jgi:hypothetical protein
MLGPNLCAIKFFAIANEKKNCNSRKIVRNGGKRKGTNVDETQNYE